MACFHDDVPLWVPTVAPKTLGPSEVLEFIGVVLDSNRMDA